MSIPFLRNRMAEYLDYLERCKGDQVGSRRSASPPRARLSSAERIFRFRRTRSARGRVHIPTYRQIRSPLPDFSASPLTRPDGVSVGKDEAASSYGTPISSPPQTQSRSSGVALPSGSGSRLASQAASPARAGALSVSTPDDSAAEALLLLRTKSRGRSTVARIADPGLLAVQDGSVKDGSISSPRAGSDGTLPMSISEGFRHKTPLHRIESKNDDSFASPEADQAFDDSTDGSEYDPELDTSDGSGSTDMDNVTRSSIADTADISNGSGSADMNIVTRSSINVTPDASGEPMDLETPSPRSPESEPSFGNQPYHSTPHVAPLKQVLDLPARRLFATPTSFERRESSGRQDVARLPSWVPFKPRSSNPFIDADDIRWGIGQPETQARIRRASGRGAESGKKVSQMTTMQEDHTDIFS